jgi:hypothetical protein
MDSATVDLARALDIAEKLLAQGREADALSVVAKVNDALWERVEAVRRGER